MAIYETVKCPNCNQYLKFLERRSSHGKFGTPIIRCTNCKSLIKTKKKLWEDLNYFHKFSFFLSMFMASFIYSLLPVFIVIFFIIGIDNADKHFNKIIITGIISILVLFVYQIMVLRKNIKLARRDFNEKKFELQDY